jgi:hypothetical protein
MGPLADFRVPKDHIRQQALKWIDDKQENQDTGLRANDFKDDLLVKGRIAKIEVHRTKDPNQVIKSLRPKNLSLAQITGVKNFQQVQVLGDSISNPVGKQKKSPRNKKEERETKNQEDRPEQVNETEKQKEKGKGDGKATPDIFYKKANYRYCEDQEEETFQLNEDANEEDECSPCEPSREVTNRTFKIGSTDSIIKSKDQSNKESKRIPPFRDEAGAKQGEPSEQIAIVNEEE